MSPDFSYYPRSHGPIFLTENTELPHLYYLALQSIILLYGFR